MDNYSDLETLSPGDVSSPSDIGTADGAGGVEDLGSNPDAIAEVDSSDLGNIYDVAPLDNINGTSGTNGNAQPVLNSLFSTSNPMGSILDALTGGASGLGDELDQLIDPTPANTTTTGLSSTGLLLVGGGIILLILLVSK